MIRVSKIEMDYNSEKEDIRLPEYGRTIQGMLHHAKQIANPEHRQQTVEAVIALMQQINPTNRNFEDYKDKLWNHAFRIANYDLDVRVPAGVIIRKEEEKIRPEAVTYPYTTKKFRHYGHNVQTLIEKAIEMPDGSKKEGFVEVIASYMKLAYRTWNKEHYVSDDVVKVDLEALSEGQLELHEGHNSLDTLAYSASKKDKSMQQRSGGSRTSTRKGVNQSAGRKDNTNTRKRSFSSGNVQSDNTNNFRKRKK
jgi:hypothetical protein